MSDGNSTSLFVFETAEDEAQNIDELPDAEQATCEQLNNAADDLAGVDAMNTAKADEDE